MFFLRASFHVFPPTSWLPHSVMTAAGLDSGDCLRCTCQKRGPWREMGWASTRVLLNNAWSSEEPLTDVLEEGEFENERLEGAWWGKWWVEFLKLRTTILEKAPLLRCLCTVCGSCIERAIQTHFGPRSNTWIKTCLKFLNPTWVGSGSWISGAGASRRTAIDLSSLLPWTLQASNHLRRREPGVAAAA